MALAFLGAKPSTKGVSMQSQSFRIAIFLGGPSNERNISLDSARTFYDSIRKTVGESSITLVLVHRDGRFVRLEHEWIYSNTIEDFEHLAHMPLDEKAVDQLIRESDVICPMIHGEYGEDGRLTARVEALGRQAYIGSGPEALANTLDKAKCHELLKKMGLPVTEHLTFSIDELRSDPNGSRARVREAIPLDARGRVIVKPRDRGSSDGVSLVAVDDLLEAAERAARYSDQVLVERRIVGREFSLIILQDLDGAPCALLPTEVSLHRSDSDTAEIYSRLKKYMPGAGADHFTPMAVEEPVLKRLREQGELLFQRLEMQDWARFDGFLTPDGEILWSDLNGIPGYGQDSFLFQQAALFGMDDHDVSALLLARALQKEKKPTPTPSRERGGEARPVVAVIGGGATSERHISRMSWANVIHKLHALERYEVHNIFMDGEGRFWDVSRFISLQHTVEEIEHLLQNHDPSVAEPAARAKGRAFAGYSGDARSANFAPRLITLEELAKRADFVFLALHGGIGENGEMQATLERLGLPYNGSDSTVSAVCMDKSKTNRLARDWAIDGFLAPNQEVVSAEDVAKALKEDGLAGMIQHWQEDLESAYGVVLKPAGDGCSSGVLVARHPKRQAPIYLEHALRGDEKVPMHLLYPDIEDREAFLQMPTEPMKEFLVEQFLGDPEQSHHQSFIEITVGVLGSRGNLLALLPSETVAASDLLTLDEKFNKGVGVNLTPPPRFDDEITESIRLRIKTFAEKLGIEGYARVDAMYHTTSDQLYLIEVNTLPGLTPATIIYTQAMLTPETRMKPSEFLGRIIELGLEREKARR